MKGRQDGRGRLTAGDRLFAAGTLALALAVVVATVAAARWFGSRADAGGAAAAIPAVSESQAAPGNQPKTQEYEETRTWAAAAETETREAPETQETRETQIKQEVREKPETTEMPEKQEMPKTQEAPEAPETQEKQEKRGRQIPALTEEERETLARLVFLEAGGEGTAGKRGVAETVLNRMADPRFPDTLDGVVYDEEPCVQFAPARRIPGTQATESCYAAVDAALSGERVLDADHVFFNTSPITRRGMLWIGAICFSK
jgi:spore germination cell wall hydrolase CwlJ-like protein